MGPGKVLGIKTAPARRAKPIRFYARQPTAVRVRTHNTYAQYERPGRPAVWSSSTIGNWFFFRLPAPAVETATVTGVVKTSSYISSPFSPPHLPHYNPPPPPRSPRLPAMPRRHAAVFCMSQSADKTEWNNIFLKSFRGDGRATSVLRVVAPLKGKGTREKGAKEDNEKKNKNKRTNEQKKTTDFFALFPSRTTTTLSP